MSGTAIRAGRAFVEIFTRDRALQRGLKRANRKLRAFASGIGRMGAKLGLIGAVVAGSFAVPLKIFTEFSDRMNEVRAVTGAAGAEFEKLNQTAQKLGRETSFSASQVAEGMKFLGMAGFTTQQILEGIPAVLNLARAGAIDLGLAADIASDVGSAFGLTADQIGHLADVMAATASSANTSVALMGETFKFVAPVAKAAGQSLEEVSAALGILGNNGIKGSNAGTDLKNVLANIAGESAQKIKALGVSIEGADGKMRPMLDIMRDIGNATQDLSQTERLALFFRLFGKISAKSALILADAGTEVDRLRGVMDKADGTAKKMAKTMNSGLGGAARSLKSALEGVAIEIGKALSPMMVEWAERARAAAQQLAVLIDQNPELVAMIVKMTAAVIGGGLALLAVAFVIKAITFIIGTFLGVLAAIAGTIMFVLSPLGLLIAGITALTVWFLKSTAEGRYMVGILKRGFASLKADAIEAFDGIRDAIAVGDIHLAFRILIAGLKLQWRKFVLFLNTEFADQVDVFLEVIETIKTVFAGLRTGFMATIDFVKSAWKALTGFIKSNWDGVARFINKQLSKLPKSMQIDVRLGTFGRIQKIEGRSVQGRRLQERDRGDQSEPKPKSGLTPEQEKRRRKSEDDLAQAQRDFDALTREAAARRKTRDKADAEEAAKKQNNGKAPRAAPANAQFAVSRAATVFGSFNARALLGSAGGGIQQQIAAATNKTATNTAAIANDVSDIRNNPTVFS